MINLVKKIKTSKGAVCTFDIDTSADLTSLPISTTNPECVLGSIANCIAEGVSYILNSSDEWVKQDSHINYNEEI